MKSRYLKIGAPLLILPLLCAGYAWLSTPAEPVWNERPLSAWLDDLTRGPSKEVREPAEIAIHSMGPKAIPPLIRMLRARDSAFKPCLEWLSRRNLLHVQVKDARNEHLRAWLGFQALGEAGEPAIPELGRLLILKREVEYVPQSLAAISSNCVPVLLDALPRVPAERRCSILHEAFKWPSEEKRIFAALVKSLSDPDWRVRLCAASLLERCQANSALAIRALISTLEDPQYEVQVRAIRSLAHFGTNAAPALPQIEKLSRNPNYAPWTVTNALLRLRGLPAEDLPPAI